MKNNISVFSKIFFLITIMNFSSTTKADVKILSYETRNGVKVLFSKSENIPMIDIKITFDAGSSKDGSLKGLSMLTHNLLDEGTSKKKSEEIASIFESTGSVFSTSVNKDRSTISLRSLTDEKYFNPCLKMFLEILSDSSFPISEVNLQKNRTISTIIEDKSDPSEIASSIFFKEIYGDHPYASQSIGNENSVKKINRKNILDFYQKHISSSNASIAIVSSLPKDQVIEISEKISKSLERK